MISPSHLVKVMSFSRSICVIWAPDSVASTGHNDCSLHAFVSHFSPSEDARFVNSCVIGICLPVCPWPVAQESGFQCGVQGKEGLNC